MPAVGRPSSVADETSSFEPGRYAAPVAYEPGGAFSLVAPVLPLSADATGFGVSLSRTLDLVALDDVEDALQTVGSNAIFGTYTETIAADGRPELNHQMTGRFSLSREAAKSPAPQAVGGQAP